MSRQAVVASPGAGRGPKSPPHPEAQYLYGIIPAQPELRIAAGLENSEVRAVTHGKVSAVVSALSTGKVRPERRNLAAHQQVLNQLMQQEALLPVSFGTATASAAGVRKFLARNEKMLAEQLARVRGRVEMGLRVTWVVPNIFEYFVDRHSDLRQARDELFGAQHEATQEEKLGLGRLFERLLEEDREAHTSHIEEALEPLCSELKRGPCRQEREVANLACLVARPALTEFEDAVFAAARHFDNSFAFDYNGPWPPYHFVELEVEV